MAIPLLLLFLSLSFQIQTSSPTKITLPLIPTIRPPSPDPLQTLTHLASQSISRAHHLKHPIDHTQRSTSLTVKAPLFPRGYGAHSVPLSFGTPPQPSTFVMDTGSSLVWLPCTSRYLCSACSTSATSAFIPRNSSSAKLVGCANPKCAWLFGSGILSKCPSPKQAPEACPPYFIQYGLGSTSGLLLSETLSFTGEAGYFPDFLVGCSVVSSHQPEGVAGFGRSPESLPSQLNLKRFSYCLVSHRYDDVPRSSDLVLGGSSSSAGLGYTPFRPNPNASNAAFKDYYYLNLRRIIVGEKVIKVPHVYAVPGEDGNGGTIVDSGSTFTYMEKPLFDLVEAEFRRQLGNYTAAKEVEDRTGLRPCFRVSDAGEPVSLPGMALRFKGGASMELPLSNYVALLASNAACLIFVTDGGKAGPAARGGPSVILGNYQQMNYHVEYDLEKQRFGFKRQNCLSSTT